MSGRSPFILQHIEVDSNGQPLADDLEEMGPFGAGLIGDSDPVHETIQTHLNFQQAKNAAAMRGDWDTPHTFVWRHF